MPRPAKNQKTNGKSTGGNLGFEAALWQAADEVHANMDAEHVVRLGQETRENLRSLGYGE